MKDFEGTTSRKTITRLRLGATTPFAELKIVCLFSKRSGHQIRLQYEPWHLGPYQDLSNWSNRHGQTSERNRVGFQSLHIGIRHRSVEIRCSSQLHFRMAFISSLFSILPSRMHWAPVQIADLPQEMPLHPQTMSQLPQPSCETGYRKFFWIKSACCHGAWKLLWNSSWSSWESTHPKTSRFRSFDLSWGTHSSFCSSSSKSQHPWDIRKSGLLGTKAFSKGTSPYHGNKVLSTLRRSKNKFPHRSHMFHEHSAPQKVGVFLKFLIFSSCNLQPVECHCWNKGRARCCQSSECHLSMISRASNSVAGGRSPLSCWATCKHKLSPKHGNSREVPPDGMNLH